MELATQYSTKIQPFIDYLARLTERPSLDDLSKQMRKMSITMDDVKNFAHFSDQGYRRNVVFQSDVVQLLCLCWQSGQRSPIHDHADSICGVKVMQGVATETIFEHTPSGYIKPITSVDYDAGVLVSEDSDTHQVSNLQAAGDDLVTLHVYSPPLNRMKLFTIDSKEMQVYAPINEWHADGSGI